MNTAPAEPLGAATGAGTVTGASGATRTGAPAGAVERIVLGSGVLGAWRAVPASGDPRSVLVAVHGRAMSPGYFAGPVAPHSSLLALATSLGHTVIAVERPGYGRSRASFPLGLPLADQAGLLRLALAEYAAAHPVGAGFFLLGHSDGGKTALHLAGEPWGEAPAERLLGLDLNGCGRHYSPAAARFPDTLGGGAGALNWGPLRLYPGGTFRASRALLRAVPAAEEAETVHWPARFPDAAAKVRCPVRLTFGEYEGWWRLDPGELAAVTACFTRTRPPAVDRLPGAGHNLSLGLAAPVYHLRALMFLEECLGTVPAAG
ncbi:alpha/beta hydrolase [Streptomyces sp. NBC_01754]|uniref:alpha/beta hydrolase n=1 Tax=Streptomyces sp. NBC_01754 TaxID=2975930 RepID=UPI002DD80C1E|nr:alpha/beta hydrolase [Streptomyces sp. NBC_01754]WSC95292.1 alpha/beta hydrolase [Streptomyces sp. NBC_01754]